MRKLFFIYFSAIISIFFSQPETNFTWPLDSPLVFTANYGQLRPNHFHAGVDLSTGGKVNLPVYAAEEGYVSRIKVSAYGYGKCLYITHPNGKVTVYAHMNAYCAKVDTFIKKEQTKIQSYEIDFYPKEKIKIKRKEIVGLSGNTGGSTGPHLHFEIRDELSEVPLNPLNYYKVPDRVKPTLQAIAIFNLSDSLNPKSFKTIKVKEINGISTCETPSITINQSIIGFAFAGYDRMKVNGHLNNIYSSKLFLDGKEIYSHLLQAVSFDESRYVNQYAEASQKWVFQKCFLPVLAPADFVMNSTKHTRIVLADTNFHEVKIVVADERGNSNQVKLHIKTNQFSKYRSNISKYDVVVDCRKELNYSKNNLSLICPPYTFFISTPLIVENTIETTGKLILLPGDVNLKSALQVRFTTPSKYQNNKTKLVLKNNGNVYIPTVKGDSISYMVKNLGWFQLDVDIVPPSIQMVPKSKKKSQKPNNISFIIKDGLSSIASYKLYINNQWVLAEHDAKNHLLSYQFDKTTPFGNLEIRLDVEDKVGNRSSKTIFLKR